MFRPSVVAIATLGMLIFSTNQAFAGPHLNEFGPNGVSPWVYYESWTVTNGYGTGLHTDQYTDYYALDLVPGSGSACGKPVYPLFNGMTVNYVDSATWGRIDLTVTIGGVQYKTKYLHLSSITKGVGSVVGPNDVIGYTGNKQTGGCHLHMNVQKLSGGVWYGIKPKFCNTVFSYVGQSWPGC
jgi:murein DD-endopeptidase MepM/ murein hydrolase activator NlpD